MSYYYAWDWGRRDETKAPTVERGWVNPDQGKKMRVGEITREGYSHYLRTRHGVGKKTLWKAARTRAIRIVYSGRPHKPLPTEKKAASATQQEPEPDKYGNPDAAAAKLDAATTTMKRRGRPPGSKNKKLGVPPQKERAA